MELRKEIISDGREMRIKMPEKFNFNVHKNLRKAYESHQCETYRLDLSSTSYMDSSALGMLLQIREFAGDKQDSVVIESANDNIKEILRVANFEKMMVIK